MAMEENKVVCTEITTFLWGHQIIDDQGARKPNSGEDCVFVQEDDDHHKQLKSEGKKDHDDQSDVNEDKMDHKMEIFHEAAIGKGLSGAQRLLQERGMIEKSTDHRSGQINNIDKKKSQLVGVKHRNDHHETSTQLKDARLRRVYENKEIHIDSLDEYGREMSLKEAFREFSHKFHGKRPGKRRQEKRLKQYRQELKMKQVYP